MSPLSSGMNRNTSAGVLSGNSQMIFNDDPMLKSKQLMEEIINQNKNVEEMIPERLSESNISEARSSDFDYYSVRRVQEEFEKANINHKTKKRYLSKYTEPTNKNHSKRLLKNKDIKIPSNELQKLLICKNCKEEVNTNPIQKQHVNTDGISKVQFEKSIKTIPSVITKNASTNTRRINSTYVHVKANEDKISEDEISVISNQFEVQHLPSINIVPQPITRMGPIINISPISSKTEKSDRNVKTYHYIHENNFTTIQASDKKNFNENTGKISDSSVNDLQILAHSLSSHLCNLECNDENASLQKAMETLIKNIDELHLNQKEDYNKIRLIEKLAKLSKILNEEINVDKNDVILFKKYEKLKKNFNDLVYDIEMSQRKRQELSKGRLGTPHNIFRDNLSLEKSPSFYNLTKHQAETATVNRKASCDVTENSFKDLKSNHNSSNSSVKSFESKKCYSQQTSLPFKEDKSSSSSDNRKTPDLMFNKVETVADVHQEEEKQGSTIEEYQDDWEICESNCTTKSNDKINFKHSANSSKSNSSASNEIKQNIGLPSNVECLTTPLVSLQKPVERQISETFCFLHNSDFTKNLNEKLQYNSIPCKNDLKTNFNENAITPEKLTNNKQNNLFHNAVDVYPKSEVFRDFHKYLTEQINLLESSNEMNKKSKYNVKIIKKENIKTSQQINKREETTDTACQCSLMKQLKKPNKFSIRKTSTYVKQHKKKREHFSIEISKKLSPSPDEVEVLTKNTKSIHKDEKNGLLHRLLPLPENINLKNNDAEKFVEENANKNEIPISVSRNSSTITIPLNERKFKLVNTDMEKNPSESSNSNFNSKELSEGELGILFTSSSYSSGELKPKPLDINEIIQDKNETVDEKLTSSEKNLIDENLESKKSFRTHSSEDLPKVETPDSTKYADERELKYSPNADILTSISSLSFDYN